MAAPTVASDAVAWSVAADRWEALGYRHRAGYARWRQAEALLAVAAGRPGGRRRLVLSAAAGLAVEHVPLMTHDSGSRPPRADRHEQPRRAGAGRALQPSTRSG